MNKIIIVSLFLNAILLSFLFGLVPFLLYVSALLNGFLIWYSWKAITQNDQLQEDLDELTNDINAFSNHVEDIHGLEMFYGDETLQALINHSRELVNRSIDFQEKYFDIEVIEPNDSENNPPPSPEAEE
tara:strand:+ start:428 stop:814 length:387 start_codon:yes stop_codon:yes gene_type:complete